MFNYFLGKRTLPQVSETLSLLNTLKERISRQDYSKPFDEYHKAEKLFESIKAGAIDVGDEDLANAQYVAKVYFKIFSNLSAYLALIKDKEYEKSWLKLQDCIDCAVHFCRYVPNDQRLEADELIDLFHEYEKLYPYTLFFSTEYTIKANECSICGKSTFDLDCPHITGNLYWGECACVGIKEISEMPAIAIVSHPKDKRCVAHISDDETPEEIRFKSLDKLFPQFENPIQTMEIDSELQQRRNPDVKKQGRNELCLCGSGKKFKKCCIKNMYHDHLHFKISVKNEIQLIHF